MRLRSAMLAAPLALLASSAGAQTCNLRVVTDAGPDFLPRGTFETRLRRKDVPANHMLPDDETGTGPIFELVLPEPVPARRVRFRILPSRILTVSEVEVLDFVRYDPFDLKIALSREVKS